MNFWHSRHSSQIKLSSQDLHQISRKINQDYAPTVARHSPELVLLPVDPYHLYAYWNITENQSDSKQNDAVGNELTLRIYWRPDEIHDTSKTKLWFDVAVNSQSQQKVRLPVDETVYSAAIGWCIQGHGFVACAYSNIIHVPRGRMAPLQEKPDSEENIDIENRKERDSFREIATPDGENKTADVESQNYDEALIDSKIKETLYEKGIGENIDMILNPDRVAVEESIRGLSIVSSHESLEHNTSSKGNRK